ncbi:MAG: T9SS type A sorting domain-containing protein [Bacteroidetes bacterium]|nr:T9SS type A sorting domain-containing protein [Bacteroidota bacterium]
MGIDDGYDIEVDGTGNIIATGYYQFTVDFDPGVSVYNKTATGGQDVFVIKLNSSGNLIWANSIGGSMSDYGTSLSLDASGAIYTIGQYGGTMDFDPGAGIFSMTAVGGSDVYITKTDPSGNFIWAKSMGGTLSEWANAIETDNSGNVVFTGYFGGTADFDPSPSVFNIVSVAVTTDIFLAKLDANGNFLWAKQLGGTGFDLGASLAIDTWGNVFSTGFFSGTADFDPGAGTYNISAVGTGNTFISKLDVSGNFVWAGNIGGTNSNFGASISINASNEIFCAGSFIGTVDLNPGAGVFTATSSGIADVYLIKLDNTGGFNSALYFGGTLDDNPNGIYIDQFQNMYLAGTFNGTTDFDPGAGIFNLTSVGIQNSFVTKLTTSPPLPIELLHFTAKPAAGNIELNWSTLQEINNEFFTLEKAIHPSEWYEIGIVQGGGNTSTLREYQFSDQQPVSGIQYYRLKQTDTDGRFSYTNIVAVNYDNNKKTSFLIYPNPASDIVFIELDPNNLHEDYLLRIMDAGGCLLSQMKLRNSIQELDLRFLAPGFYILEIVADGKMLQNTLFRK